MRGHDHRAAGAAAQRDDFLLPRGHVFGRDFHAEVATGNHDGIGPVDDRVDAVERGWLLDLRDQTSPAVDDPGDFIEIGGFLHERQRHPVDAVGKAELKICSVLLG